MMACMASSRRGRRAAFSKGVAAAAQVSIAVSLACVRCPREALKMRLRGGSLVSQAASQASDRPSMACSSKPCAAASPWSGRR